MAGDAALYVDPYDENEIASGMKRILEDVKLRSDLIIKGKEQIKKFHGKNARMKPIKFTKRFLVTNNMSKAA